MISTLRDDLLSKIDPAKSFPIISKSIFKVLRNLLVCASKELRTYLTICLKLMKEGVENVQQVIPHTILTKSNDLN